MVYARKFKKVRKTRRPRAKTVLTRAPKSIYGTHKSWTVTNPGITMDTNSANRKVIIRCSDIAAGDLYSERGTNAVWINNVQVFLNCRNTATTSRYIRIIALTVQPSLDAADTSNLSDCYTTGNMATIVGPTGFAEDTIYNMNRNLYRPLFNRVVKIPGTSNGESNSKNFKFNIPVRKVCVYEYNSTTTRRNPIILMWHLCEAEGVTPGTVTVPLTYRVTTHFKDKIK